jgi:hypothetical protein
LLHNGPFQVPLTHNCHFPLVLSLFRLGLAYTRVDIPPALPRSCFDYSSTIKMEAICPSKSSRSPKATWCYNQERHSLYVPRVFTDNHKNFWKSQIYISNLNSTYILTSYPSNFITLPPSCMPHQCCQS